jgi:serine/threonine protein kinase
MLAALHEPALVEVLWSGTQNGTAYMAMPLYEGRTLKDVLRDSPRPREAWLKTMFGPLLDALATLHRSGRCPCDVTPDNIVVLADGAPLFIGFGVAPRIVASTTNDVTGVLNSGFAAYERYACDPELPEGPWTDIYSIAAVLHLAITGKLPPAPTTRMVADTMPPMSDVTSDYSKRFLDALDRGLALAPTNRPQTIAEFRAALGIFSMASGAIPMPHPTSSSPVPEPRLPRSSSQPTTGHRLGGWPSTLVMSLIVVSWPDSGFLFGFWAGLDR